MSIQLPQVETNRPAPCRHLRTKTAFGALINDLDESHDWFSGNSNTAVYWCLRTMETAGLDDQYAHPSTCLPGRTCYSVDDL